MRSLRSLFMGFDALVVPSKSISTNAQYVAQHWKSWMRFISQIQKTNWKIARTLEKTTAFRALERCKKHSQIIFSDRSLFLIG
jgi:hypothetical protein